jgi:hypothetical protein
VPIGLRWAILTRRHLIAKVQPRLVLVVGPATQLKIVDDGCAARGERLDVVEFEECCFLTAAE